MASDPDARWEQYYCRSDGGLQSIAVDVDLHALAPIPTLPVLTRIAVPVKGDDVHFFFTPDEGDVLDRAVEGLEAIVARRSGGWRRAFRGPANEITFAGRRSREGESELYFYSRRPVEKAALVELEQYLPGVDWSCVERDDPEWKTYLDLLHPGPALRSLQLTRAQIDMRRENGEDLDAVRPVDHTLYFRDDEGRRAFLEETHAEREAAVRTYEDDGGDARFGVDLTIEHSVFRAIVEPYVVALAQRAARFGGVYDGWGAPSIRTQSASH